MSRAPASCDNPDVNKPVHVSFVVRGASPEEVFAALLDIGSFPNWAFGLKGAKSLGGLANGLISETIVGFTSFAAGITHEVVGTVTVVEAPWREWCYAKRRCGRRRLDPGGSRQGEVFDRLRGEKPAWSNRPAKRPYFGGVTEDLLRNSMRRFPERLAEGRAPPTRP